MDAQKLKIYIVLENPETREAVNINGSFDLFKNFLDSFADIQATTDPIPHPAKAFEPAQM